MLEPPRGGRNQMQVQAFLYGPPGANTGKFTVSSNECVINTLERGKTRGGGHRGEEMSYLMPTLSGDGSRILLFLNAVRYERHEEILPEFFLTVKNLSFAPGGPPRGS